MQVTEDQMLLQCYLQLCHCCSILFVCIALLFSATFRKKVEKLCRDCLSDPVRIIVGDLGEANTDITQVGVAKLIPCALCNGQLSWFVGG